MNAAHLAQMANQIGAFFESQGTHEQAVAGIADHLRRFWEARMLRALGAHVVAGGADLSPSVLEAVHRLGLAAPAPGPAAASEAAPAPGSAPASAPGPDPSRRRAGGPRAA